MKTCISAKTWRKVMKATLFATAKNSPHASLAGVSFEFSAGIFCAVATDGHRLALFKAPSQYQESSVRFILARKDLAHPSTTVFLRRAAQADGLLEVELTGEMVFISWGGECLRLKNITSPFPSWTLVFPPEEESILVRCNKAAFQNTLLYVRRKTRREDRRVVLRLRHNAVFLAPASKWDSEGEKVPAEYTKTAFGVFNADYLLDAVKALCTGNLEIRFRPSEGTDGILTPTEFRSTGRGYKGNIVRQLIMPCYPVVPPWPGE